MLPRERVEAALAFRTPDRVPLQVFPSPAGLHEHGRKLLDLARECGSDFGDMALLELPDPPPASDFDPDGRYHAIRTDEWGTTWEHRIFGVWGYRTGYPLADIGRLAEYQLPRIELLEGEELARQAEAGAKLRRNYFHLGGGDFGILRALGDNALPGVVLIHFAAVDQAVELHFGRRVGDPDRIAGMP